MPKTCAASHQSRDVEPIHSSTNSLLPVQVGPLVVDAHLSQLAGCKHTSGLVGTLRAKNVRILDIHVATQGLPESPGRLLSQRRSTSVRGRLDEKLASSNALDGLESGWKYL